MAVLLSHGQPASMPGSRLPPAPTHSCRPRRESRTRFPANPYCARPAPSLAVHGLNLQGNLVQDPLRGQQERVGVGRHESPFPDPGSTAQIQFPSPRETYEDQWTISARGGGHRGPAHDGGGRGGATGRGQARHTGRHGHDRRQAASGAAWEVRRQDRAHRPQGSKPTGRPRIVPPKGAPNVLLIMTDDSGYGVPSTFGGVIPTPALDRIAANGLRYTNFHSTALCSPTRAALITGRNHHSVGLRRDLRAGHRVSRLRQHHHQG